jgi:chromosome partitioning protein
VTRKRLYPALMNARLALPDSDYPETLVSNGFCLEEIPDFGALLPRSHEAGVPVFALRDEELGATGVVLAGTIAKRDQIHAQLIAVALTLQDLMN